MDKYEDELEFLDSLVDHLRTLPVKDNIRVLVPERLAQFQAAYRAMERVANAMGGTIFSELRGNEGWGSLTVEAKELILDRELPFPTELTFASNFEVYPLANGKIRLAAMFYGLTKSIV